MGVDAPYARGRVEKGCVIVFSPNATDEQINKAMNKLYTTGVLHYPPTIHSFDPSDGGPVWYIP